MKFLKNESSICLGFVFVFLMSLISEFLYGVINLLQMMPWYSQYIAPYQSSSWLIAFIPLIIGTIISGLVIKKFSTISEPVKAIQSSSIVFIASVIPSFLQRIIEIILSLTILPGNPDYLIHFFLISTGTMAARVAVFFIVSDLILAGGASLKKLFSWVKGSFDKFFK